MATARRRALGQHFLADGRIARRIVEAFDPRPNDQVLEVGPGEGALTDRLVGRVHRLVAVELDPGLAERLEKRYAGRDDVRLVRGDMRKTTIEELPFPPGERVRFLSNLPYSAGTPILKRVLEQRARVRDLLVMVQKEVGERIVAREGEPQRGYLSVLVQLLARAERVLRVGPGAFRPPPQVDSVVLRLIPRPRPAAGPDDPGPLLALASAGFRSRRKTLFRNLAAATGLERETWAGACRSAGIGEKVRAEEMSLGAWGRLHAALQEGSE
jgi:16S rRNA (adenine1518-N6/adenine1519-N6)-dimethyltransferase